MSASLPDGSRLEVVTHPSGNCTVLTPRGELEPPPVGARRGSVAWYVPYTAVHPQTAETAPPDAVWIDVCNSSIAYYAAVLDIWERGENFALLEHDVVCRPDVVEAFEACPEPWCLYGYDSICHPQCQEAWRNQLGCTRFRAELVQAVPDAISSIPRENWDWHEMCNGLGENLRVAGFTHHWHHPPVEHHRETHVLAKEAA